MVISKVSTLCYIIVYFDNNPFSRTIFKKIKGQVSCLALHFSKSLLHPSEDLGTVCRGVYHCYYTNSSVSIHHEFQYLKYKAI